MLWTPLSAYKHKQRKQDMSPLTTISIFWYDLIAIYECCLILRYIIKRLITGSCKPMLFFFYLSSSVDINKIPITANMGTTSLTRTFEENSGVHPFMTSILQMPTLARHGPLALHFRRQYIIRQLITDSCKPMLLSFIFFFL